MDDVASTGVGAGSLAFGIIEAVIWSSRADKFNGHTGPTANDPTGTSRNCGDDETNHGGAGCAALYDDVTRARTLSLVGLAVGGLLAGGTAALFVLSAPRDTGPANASTACVPNLYSPGVVCRLTF